jgi:hypothetical protein
MDRRNKVILLSIVIVFCFIGIFSSCQSSKPSISKYAYQSLEAQVSEAESRASKAIKDYDRLNKSYHDLSAADQSKAFENQSIAFEYQEYKKTMKEYEDLAEADASARKASLVVEEESRAASKASEEESIAASKATEEAKGYETGVTYDQLARTPEDFKGSKVKFRGKVLQVIEGSYTNMVAIRFAVNENYDTVIYCEYLSGIVSSRILEDDIITIYGTSKGLKSYQSTLGGTITIPYVYLDKIEQ